MASSILDAQRLREILHYDADPAFPPVPQQAPTGMQGIETPTAADNLQGA